MKTRNNFYNKIILIIGMVLGTVFSCEKDLTDDAVLASRPTTAEIFTDSPIGLGSDFYFPYGPEPNNPIGSNFTAWSIDTEESYIGEASMRFDVPNASDPEGNFAGGILRIEGDNSGRDLSGYDALTFWAKASQGAVIGQIGFGEDFIENKYIALRKDISLTTNWVKYIIPIPDPSRLTNERGMFTYSTGGINDFGFAFWIDELRFEKLGTFVYKDAKISGGADVSQTSFESIVMNIADFGLETVFNLPNTIDVSLVTAPSYFDFTSSEPSVASINSNGVINVGVSGSSKITATLMGNTATGSLTINSSGEFEHAPTPTRDPNKVISIFSDHYNNTNVDFFNGYWQPWQTTESADFVVDGDNVLNYTNFNFVGTQFASPTVDATDFPNLHLNMYIPGEVPANLDFLITLESFGSDGVDGGGDDIRQQVSYKASDLLANTWNTIEIPITLGDRRNMGLFIYENINGSQLENFYLDNIYFYDNGVDGPQLGPEDAPEAPTEDEIVNNVISIFSDAYTDVPNESLNFTPLGATLTIENIANNNVLKYLNLNFIEQEFAPNTIDASMSDMLHIDVWSPVDNDMRITLKDYGENGSSFSEATIILEGLEQNQWKSFDIPLTDFNGSPERGHIGRIIINNGASTPNFTGTLFIDNIYFYTN